MDIKVLETEITLEPATPLRIGMTVDVAIDASPVEAMVIVPRTAIRETDGKTTVSIVEGNLVTTRQVRTGAHDLEHIAILDGLERGEKVVVP